jgi:hypothetical protein
MTPKSKGPNLTFSGRLAQPSRKRTRGRHALSLIWNYRPGSRKAGAVPSRADERLWLGRPDTPSAPITYCQTASRLTVDTLLNTEYLCRQPRMIVFWGNRLFRFGLLASTAPFSTTVSKRHF